MIIIHDAHIILPYCVQGNDTFLWYAEWVILFDITINTMMGYGGSVSMMGGAGLLGTLTWLVIIIDLVLVGIWLWQHISKK